MIQSDTRTFLSFTTTKKNFEKFGLFSRRSKSSLPFTVVIYEKFYYQSLYQYIYLNSNNVQL